MDVAVENHGCVSPTVKLCDHVGKTPKLRTTEIRTDETPTFGDGEACATLTTIGRGDFRYLSKVRAVMTSAPGNSPHRIISAMNQAILVDHFEPAIFTISNLS